MKIIEKIQNNHLIIFGLIISTVEVIDLKSIKGINFNFFKLSNATPFDIPSI
jgi:hypothetical protein